MRTIGFMGVAGLALGGVGGAIGGGIVGAGLGFLMAGLSNKPTGEQIKNACVTIGGLGALIGGPLGALAGAWWFASLAAAGEVLVNAPQQAINFATNVDKVGQKMLSGDVSPGTIKQAVGVVIGGIVLYKTVGWAASTLFGNHKKSSERQQHSARPHTARPQM